MPLKLQPFSWERIYEAVEAVRRRALKATTALAAADIPYAMAGGNAVAAWVARADRAAVRNTQDVDILIQRSDFERVKRTLEQAGFYYHHVLGVDCFLDSPQANPRDAVHILFAGEKVKPHDLGPTPEITEREPADDYDILKLESLVQMKLTAYRRKDQVHLLDMISVQLIDETWPSRFQPELAARLQQLLNDPDG